MSTAVPATTVEDGSEQFEAPFTLLVSGQSKDEIARSFAALLQLVNNGNIVIDKGPARSESYCFTAENPFRLRLLNAQNCHEGMFENMVPSADVTGRASSSIRSKGKGPRPQQSLDHQRPRPALRIRTPEVVPERLRSPVVSPYSTRTPGGSGFRVRSFPAVFMSPTGSSVRRSSRKRGQSVVGRVVTTPMDNENRGVAGTSDDKGYTPVKLTPNRRQTKRKPLQSIQL